MTGRPRRPGPGPSGRGRRHAAQSLARHPAFPRTEFGLGRQKKSGGSQHSRCTRSPSEGLDGWGVHWPSSATLLGSQLDFRNIPTYPLLVAPTKRAVDTLLPAYILRCGAIFPPRGSISEQ